MEAGLVKYFPINTQVLDECANLQFDIFTRSMYFGETSYMKFASATDPRHQERVRDLLEAGDCQEAFFIEEQDLFKYYKNATESLKKFLNDDTIPVKVKTQKIYSVSKRIMKDFFVHNASGEILRSSEKVMELMAECLSTNAVSFNAITQIANKDYYTYTHSVNVGLYCMTYGVKVQMSRSDIRDLGVGGMLHDIGKSKIPHEIINKDGTLTDEEFEVMKTHTSCGEEILIDVGCYGKNVVAMAAQHHEKYGGGGYHNNRAGEEISYYARVCKIMDVYDALTTRRTFKKATPVFDALILMKTEMDGHFDPILLERFIRLMGPDM